MSEELYKQMAQSIIEGDSDLSVELAKKAIEINMHPLEAITKGFVVGVNYIGDQFGLGEAFLPELVMAGEAMKAAVATLEPELLKLGSARETMGRVVLATVEGDLELFDDLARDGLAAGVLALAAFHFVRNERLDLDDLVGLGGRWHADARCGLRIRHLRNLESRGMGWAKAKAGRTISRRNRRS